jgi:hypothetical protein
MMICRKVVINFLIPHLSLLALNSAISAQGINYPVGSPTGTSGAGNARTDPDNLFIRNNVAGMTEIPVHVTNHVFSLYVLTYRT